MTLPGIEPQLIVELGLLGLGTGFLAGLLGIGGGMVMVPFLTRVLTQRGVPQRSGGEDGHRHRDGDDPVHVAGDDARAPAPRRRFAGMSCARMTPGIVLGGLAAGAGVFALVKGHALALVLRRCSSATRRRQMLRSTAPKPSRRLPGRGGQAAVGGGIGFLSGLVGAGGAFIAVPFMTCCNVPIHHAVATGAAIGFPIALANTVGYVVGGWSQPPALPGALGFLYLPALVVISLASVLIAPLGARVAHSLDVRQLRRVFAVMLYVLAADMLWRGLHA